MLSYTLVTLNTVLLIDYSILILLYTSIDLQSVRQSFVDSFLVDYSVQNATG